MRQVATVYGAWNPDLFQAPRRIASYRNVNKPRDAFWTSPLLLNGRSDWIDQIWYDAPIRRHSVVVFVTDPGARILHIPDAAAYQAAWERYPYPVWLSRPGTAGLGGSKISMTSSRFLYWERISVDYDAVRVSSDALHLRALDAWDVDSVAWFRVTPLRVVDVKPASPEVP